MHPLHVELDAHLITEDRLRRAAAARRVLALTASRPRLRDRVGAGLVRAGTRLQRRPRTTPGHAAPC